MEIPTEPTDEQVAPDVDPAPPVDIQETEPDRPIDYFADGEKLMQRCIKDAQGNTARLLRDRQDILNNRFDRGGRDNHWCIWDSGTNRYVPRPEDPEQGGLPAWVPRPCTNLFRIIIRGLTSILDQSEPAQVFAPATDDEQDQATAEVAENAVPVLRDECGYDSEGHRHALNAAVTLMDKAAYCVYYDTDEKWGTKQVDQFICPECQLVSTPVEIEDAKGCPECGFEDTEQFELYTEGGLPAKPVTVSIGKIRGEFINSFEFSTPSSAKTTNAKGLPWILLHNRMTPATICGNWGSELQTLVSDKANWADGALARAYADELHRMSSPQAGGVAGFGGGASGTDGPIVYRLFHDPIVDHEVYLPQGFFGVYIANKMVVAEKLPFTDGNVNNPQPIKNILIRTWENNGMSGFGHPPADEQVPIQQSYNLTEAMIELITMHDAAPTRYIPDTVTLLDEPTGVPGDWVRYRSIDGQKPTESRGMNPPEALFSRLDSLWNKMQEVSGLNAVLMGSRPDGDPTLGEVQILEERGMATFRAPLDELITFEKDLSFMLLSIARQSAWSPRFRRIRGENGQWELKQFAAADLTGQIDIVVNRASAWPRSPLMQRLSIKEAIGNGTLPPPGMDPELQGKLLADYNLAHLKPSYDIDRKQVAREIERWKAATSPMEILPPNPQTQNLQLHLFLKQQFLKSEEAEAIQAANPQLYQAMCNHIMQIQMLRQPPPMPEPGAGGPDDGGEEAPPAKGAKGELDKAVKEGRLVPDDGKQKKTGALDDAIASGALVPDDGSGGAAAPGVAAPAMPQGPTGPSIDQLTAAQMNEPLPQPGEDPLNGGQPPV